MISKKNQPNTFFSKVDLHTPKLSDFLSNNHKMQKFMKLVRRLVNSDSSLLILGETGVGKERLARSIHLESRRKNGVFVDINCGALPESLLESELFGHEQGSFTGATRARRGCFEMAHQGTILLDEIGEMPVHLQVRLLRVLQEHEVRRVGGETPIRIDVRIMAATSRDIDQLVQEGNFRSDLLYRLSVVRLQIPPLRERREDIPALVTSCIHHFGADKSFTPKEVHPQAMQALCAYSWPGNIRELINVIERATLLSEKNIIDLKDLPKEIHPGVKNHPLTHLKSSDQDKLSFPEAWLKRPLHQVRDELYLEFERIYLSNLLQETKGRLNQTAKQAGITPRSLFDKMQRCQLRKETFKP